MIVKSLFELLYSRTYVTNEGHMIEAGDIITPSHGGYRAARYEIVDVLEYQVIIRDVSSSAHDRTPFPCAFSVIDGYINEKHL